MPLLLPPTGEDEQVIPFAPYNGRIYFADGTAAAPSMTFASDTDTGLFRAAANVLGFSATSVLFGTSTNSSNGMIQLATHTTNAGGIGFGTDTPLWRTAAGVLRFGDTGADTAQLVWNGNAGAGFNILQNVAVVTLNAQRATGSLVFQTNTVTALTIDSSQNATFAGKVTAGRAFIGRASQAMAALEVDWAIGNTHHKTLGANSTITFANATDGQTIQVFLTNTASNYTVTWPTVVWTGGVAPTMTVGAKTDAYTFAKVGSTIYGSAVQDMS
jgi:hypothetical protein